MKRITNAKQPLERAALDILAARAEIDVRTARAILTRGVDSVRGDALRARARRVLAEMAAESGNASPHRRNRITA